MRKMFSKNQIKEIVNDGIQQGEIQGGTKLYQHYYHDEDENYILKFVCKYNEELDEDEFADKYNNGEILSCIVYNGDDLGINCSPISGLHSNTGGIRFYTTDGENIEEEIVGFANIPLKEINPL